MRYLFSTDDMEPAGRFEGFRDAARKLFQLDISADPSLPYRGKVDLQIGGPAVFGQVLGSASEFFRTPELTRQTEEGAWLLMTRTGLMHVRHGDIDCDLEPGEAIIFNSIKPHAGSSIGESDTWIVQVSDTQLRALGLSDAGERTALLKKDNPIAKLIAGVFEAFDTSDTDALLSQPTALYLTDLIALALQASGDGRDIAQARGLKAARLRAVLDDIKRYFSKPDLDAADIAARLGVTPRYVHLLLEDTGRTLSEHVLDRRLAAAWHMLRDPAQRGQRIADIAFSVGFTDLSYFNRTYRRRFGETPSDTRS
ncbi:AraC family transcriptional regulator [Terrihabitans soli]|uniref:AraC family transcriptional regulator n=1 Tax=Terrihabitans soli TaxID=708113 RepID=A0A6S6QT05_9HYPH|nr:AraC family transcriptional regulator [Terrihabitans soli]BCJ90181.1 AraC family transcriptional regulator [Terrihabitans soli]